MNATIEPHVVVVIGIKAHASVADIGTRLRDDLTIISDLSDWVIGA